jgi:hypothetical protein
MPIQRSASSWEDSTGRQSNLQEFVTIFWFRILGKSLSFAPMGYEGFDCIHGQA